jgi:hypothetical protein
VTELTCTEVRDAAAEYALGILEVGERAGVARHLLICDECRSEVEDLTSVGMDLLGLVPDAEPPLGFDRRVLAHVQRPARRPIRVWAASGVAAAVAAAIALVALVPGSSAHHQVVLAALTSHGRAIGSVYTEGRPPWLEMTVHDSGVSGPVTCELIGAGGRLVRLGSFDLVNGSGYWAAPLGQSGMRGYLGLELVSSSTVIATATFTS